MVPLPVEQVPVQVPVQVLAQALVPEMEVETVQVLEIQNMPVGTVTTMTAIILQYLLV